MHTIDTPRPQVESPKLWGTPDRVREELCVLTAIFNPWQYKSRWKHYDRFQKRMDDAGATLITIEAALGDREWAIDDFSPHARYANAPVIADTLGDNRCRHDDPNRGLHRFVRVRTPYVLWLKENLLEIARRFTPSAKYVAWIDADWAFADPGWVQRTLQYLQHYDFLQMFQHYVDLGPEHQIISPPKASFAHCHLNGFPMPPPGPDYYSSGGRGKHREAWTPGGAWAARMDALDAVGGIMDFNIVGGGDNHMAHALIGQIERFFYPGMTEGYKRRLLEWQRRAQKLSHNSPRSLLGCLPGMGYHYFHGMKKQRGYSHRWRILADNQFDPDLDLMRDTHGVYQLVDRDDPRNVRMRDQTRHYFRERNEDSIDLN